jgi:uncharacterized protein YcbK (DUF882 family)
LAPPQAAQARAKLATAVLRNNQFIAETYAREGAILPRPRYHGGVSLRLAALASLLACACSATIAEVPAAIDPPAPRASGFASRKGPLVDAPDDPPLLATLVQTHTGEHVPLDDRTPSQARFSALLSDRATGDHRDLDERLLGLLRQLAGAHVGSRIELVSGYRSWKLNEMLRKKGHHVASHSQHSLGHACDFRIVPPGAAVALDPRAVEKEIRDLGWQGGVGVYPTTADWFVHADVGPKRQWVN